MGAFALQAATLVALGFVGFGAPMFVLAALSGVAGTLVRALLRTGVARSLGSSDLRGGNAFMSVGVGVTGLIGPALAAFAVGVLGTAPALMIAGVCMSICVALASLVPSLPMAVDVEEVDHDDASAPRRQATPVSLAWLLAGVAAMVVLGTMDEPALLAYSTHSLGTGVDGYGAFLTAWGVGMTAGGLVFARFVDRSMVAVATLAALATGGAWLALAVSPTLAVACVAAVLGGLGNGVCWIALVTAVQEAAPAGREGTTATRLESIVSVAPGVGIVLGGVISDLAGPRATFLLPGVLVVGVIVATVSIARARRLELGRGTTNFSPSTPGGSA